MRYSIYHDGAIEEVAGVETQPAGRRISSEEIDCGNCPNQTPNYEREVYVCSKTNREIEITQGFIARGCGDFPKGLYGGQE